MNDASSFTIEVIHWNDHKSELKAIREQVFIEEQGVPVELEWDDEDNNALHIIASIRNNHTRLAIGTARIIIKNEQGHIGRIAVLPGWRKQGFGSSILQSCIDECQKRGVKTIILNAQTYILPFYQKVGFQVSSEEFEDAGIPHKQMMLSLS